MDGLQLYVRALRETGQNNIPLQVVQANYPGIGASEIVAIFAQEGYMWNGSHFIINPANQSIGSIGFAQVVSSGSTPVMPMPPTPSVTPRLKEEKKVKQVTDKVALDSVVLPQEKKEQLNAAISQIKNEKLIFETWGFGDVFEKGTAITLLFYGTPGTGKTLAAQAIADEQGAELKIYGMAEIGSSEPGGSERTIKKIFQEAKELFLGKEKKQRVILFDECDSLLYDRNKVGVILGAQINAMLTEIERHEGIVIFTTNRIGTLDPALERRITAKIEFPFPDQKARLAIWTRMIPGKAPLAKNVSLKKLAVYPLAGGNIKNAVLNAVRMAAYENGQEISMKHFVDAIEKEAASIKAFDKGDGWDDQPHSHDELGTDVGEGGQRISINTKIKPRYQTKRISKEG